MKCPICQYENPEGTKFCGECGTKLERICPSCNLPNPPQFKFCGECGHRLEVPAEKSLKDLSFDEKIEKIQKYLPQGQQKRYCLKKTELKASANRLP